MIDREKVIKGLHCCSHTDGTNCVYCPYDNTDEDCTALMSMDALALLEKQKAVPVKQREIGMTNKEAIEAIKANYPPENYTILREALDMAIALLKEQETIVHCKDCKHWAPIKGSNICGTCEQGHLREANWFCADGEKR